MAYISYNKLWEIEFDNIVPKNDKVQDLIFNQSKLEVHDSYKNDGNMTSNSEPVNNKDVKKKFVETKNCQKYKFKSFFFEKDYNAFNLQ